MADDRKLPLIDIASVVIAPVLVMLKVGSLVFFLIEVLQGGRFEGRLQYTFFFFVFATVLVARISIRDGSKKAAIYGILLGAACFVAMMAFVEYNSPLFKAIGPVINIGLMALVWWSAHKLTWDCTHLEEGRKASGRGVLAAAGFDGTKATTTAEDDAEYNPDRSADETKKRRRKSKYDLPDTGPVGWWQRFQKYREWRKNKPHTPGVWVLYFALAAIPLFGLGQAIIPAEDTARRSSTFWQMAVYVGSALGLLMTTTLMGLRRYLEDRRASIPTAMTAAWLGIGGVLIAAFLAFGALLPRPHTETPIFSFQKGGKKDRQASKNAVVKDNSAGKGDGAAGQRKEAGDGKTNAKGGKEGGKGEGQKSSGSGDKQGKQGGSQGKQQGDKGGDGNKGNGEKDGEKSKDNKSNDKGDGKQNDQKDGPNRKADDQKGDAGKADNDGEKADGEGDEGDGSDEKSSQSSSQFMQSLEKISEGLKWVVWVVLAVVVIGGLLYFGIKYLANFTGWAKGLLDWLRGLFGRKPKAKREAVDDDEPVEEAVERPPPFAAFSNPFTDGTARQRTARELAEYTFAALDAWAWDRDAGRPKDETPGEFVARLGEEYPKVEKPAADAAALYAHALFSKADPPKDAKPRLAKLWAVFEGVGEPAGVE